MSTQEWRKCYICGDEVLWQTCGIGWHPIQYHDCKPVPGARLEQVKRERDEARAEIAIGEQEAARYIGDRAKGMVVADLVRECVQEATTNLMDERDEAREEIARLLRAALVAALGARKGDG